MKLNPARDTNLPQGGLSKGEVSSRTGLSHVQFSQNCTHLITNLIVVITLFGHNMKEILLSTNSHKFEKYCHQFTFLQILTGV